MALYKSVYYLFIIIIIISRGAELAVQSQQRRWDDASRQPQLQSALSSAGTDEWVLSWRLNEASDLFIFTPNS